MDIPEVSIFKLEVLPSMLSQTKIVQMHLLSIDLTSH